MPQLCEQQGQEEPIHSNRLAGLRPRTVVVYRNDAARPGRSGVGLASARSTASWSVSFKYLLSIYIVLVFSDVLGVAHHTDETCRAGNRPPRHRPPGDLAPHPCAWRGGRFPSVLISVDSTTTAEGGHQGGDGEP